MRWKACLIVTKETEKHINRAVASLLENGFDGIDIFAPRKISLSDSPFLIRQRCPEKATESQLFGTAISSVGKAFIKDIDFVLVLRADIVLWKQAKLFMENTIEENFFAAYFPLAPSPFFLAGEFHLPCANQLGWCEVKVTEPVSGARCIAMNKHTAALLTGWMHDVMEPAKDGLGWDYWLPTVIQDLDMPCYAASKSIAWHTGSEEDVSSNCVPPKAVLRTGFERMNAYLN